MARLTTWEPTNRVVGSIKRSKENRGNDDKISYQA